MSLDSPISTGATLATQRAETSNLGAETASCTSPPFGDGMNCAGSLSSLRFTGKFKDAEDNLDYFGAARYASQLGRCLTPDWSDSRQPIPRAGLKGPQSLKLLVPKGDRGSTGPFHVDSHTGAARNGACAWLGMLCQ